MQQPLDNATSSPPSGLLARGLFACVLIGVLMLILIGVGLFAPGPSRQESTAVVAHGMHTADIAQELADQHSIYLAPLFRISARFMAGGMLKAGEYLIPPHASTMEIAEMMRDGHSVVRLLTIAEGLRSAEIVDALNDETALVGDVPSIPVEGSMLPESYRFSFGDTRIGLVARMQKSMQEKVNEAWEHRDTDLPLMSPTQLVTLASIVEKETGKAEERPRIAGVFYNRLRLNMRLQSDPTVIYALTKGLKDLGRAVEHDDLSFSSPYNTYTSDGLPPSPICNPGVAALNAVAHPEHNNFLYFVADGSGGHAFAADLAAHNENINRWHALMNAPARK